MGIKMHLNQESCCEVTTFVVIHQMIHIKRGGKSLL